MKKGGVVFVIYGITGDLAKRKLIPAIYHLLENKQIDHFHIIGVSRGSLTPSRVLSSSKKYFGSTKKSLLKRLEKEITLVQGDFNEVSTYQEIKEHLNHLRREDIHKKIFYLATGSNFFEKISHRMREYGIASKGDLRSKVVFEKPFGRDVKSSKKLNDSIKSCFDENQIYRIDHYLGKELVEAVTLLRFTNRIIEPLWSNEHIESIHIVLDEDFGIDERGPYYDTYGAIRDMVQNHMLQLLALLTMEMPDSLSGEFFRERKARLLRQVVIHDTLLGQYSGYTKEKGIPKDSSTETFASHVLEVKNLRWSGVPIYFRTGKYLHRKESKVLVTFKPVKCSLTGECNAKRNVLEIKIHPDEGINMDFNIKKPGENTTTTATMDFCYSCKFGPNTPEGYENLFVDIMNGDQTTFTRIDELQNAWRVVDRIKRKQVFKYKKGSQGPKEMKVFNNKNNIVWK